MLIDKSPHQLSKEDIARQALEAAARALEEYNCGKVYRKAMDKAAEVIRRLKP
jgi:hypothetical protein